MNVTVFVSEFSSQLSQVSPASIPRVLWNVYLEYLWYYQPDSWVARIAYSCRVFALLLSLPVIILGLLDIASYGIARTLGVVDDVRASTSDKSTIHTTTSSPPIYIHDTPTPDSVFTDSDQDLTSSQRSRLSASTPDESLDVPHMFYASDSESTLRLSGVGVFSPAASQPPSPTTTRRNPFSEGKAGSREEEYEAQLRQRTKHTTENSISQ